MTLRRSPPLASPALLAASMAAGMLALAACNPPAPAGGTTSGSKGGEAAEEQGPHYGAVMVELGHRFEVAGKAMNANRFELAEFEVGEIEEIFEDDLPHAAPPREIKGVNLKGLAEAFAKTNLPELQKATKDRDKAAFAKAFSNAAEVCNGCHKSTGHTFIEIPGEPGAAVPKMDPLPGKP
ncbi:MAG: hypothetical protein U0359_20520 [Byssovorax sp.]